MIIVVGYGVTKGCLSWNMETDQEGGTYNGSWNQPLGGGGGGSTYFLLYRSIHPFA